MKNKSMKYIFPLVLSMFASGMQAREVTSFNADWKFKKGPLPEQPLQLLSSWDQKWTDVSLPHTWNNVDMMTRHNNFYAGDAYYRKDFTVPADIKDKRLFVRFEGVGQVADVYVNDQLVGNHKGAYSAFAIDITDAVKPGQTNRMVVKADNSARVDVIPVNHSLFGVYGGIYRPVWLVETGKINISVTDHASPGVYIRQQVNGKKADINIGVKIDNKYDTAQQVEVVTSIFTQEGKLVTEKSARADVLPQGTKREELNLEIKNPHLWNGRKDPYLYKVVTQIKQNGTVLDELTQPLGVRTVELKAGDGVYLNGNKYPMYGVTRHQDRWGAGSALLNEHHDEDLAMIMDIGATTIRLAHYQQSDYFYSKCDSLGLLVWAEIPFVNKVTTQESENAMQQMRELIRQSFNHPSIYIWGLHNEVYQPHNYTAQLTASLHDLAKTEDPDRYTVAVNGYGHMNHPVNRNADVQGMNRYFGWYERTIGDMKPWIEKLETEYPDNLFMLTEYGADANIDHQTEYVGEAIGDWNAKFFPEAFQTKMHEQQWGIISKHPYIIASYLWNMFDFAVPMWSRGGVPARNLKGLVTIDRKRKKDAYYWYKANWSEEPVVYITQRRLTDREQQKTSVTVYSNQGQPTIYLNGKELQGIRKGTTDVHYIVDNVQLQKGMNELKAVAGNGNNVTEDKINWTFTSEKPRGEAAKALEKVHAGF